MSDGVFGRQENVDNVGVKEKGGTEPSKGNYKVSVG